MSSIHATPIDIMLLVDGSGSLDASQYESQRFYANYFANQFSYGSSDARMGVVQFGNTAELVIGLSASETSVTNAIDSMTQPFGNTNHADALLSAHNEFQLNARSGALQAIILLTDGIANEPQSGALVSAINAANTNKTNGALIYALGFGSAISLTDLDYYASAPTDNFAYHFDSYADFGVTGTLDSIALELQPAQVVNAVEPQILILIAIGLTLIPFARRRPLCHKTNTPAVS